SPRCGASRHGVAPPARAPIRRPPLAAGLWRAVALAPIDGAGISSARRPPAPPPQPSPHPPPHPSPHPRLPHAGPPVSQSDPDRKASAARGGGAQALETSILTLKCRARAGRLERAIGGEVVE